MGESKKMTVADFVDEGFLQEANRLFFHPRGIAISTVQDGDELTFGKILDHRDDPEGITFLPSLISSQKVCAVEIEKLKHIESRTALFGSPIQPKPSMKFSNEKYSGSYLESKNGVVKFVIEGKKASQAEYNEWVDRS